MPQSSPIATHRKPDYHLLTMAPPNPLTAALATAAFAPGTPVAIATVDRRGRVKSAVTGVWPDGTPVTPDDRFYAASLTKQITGAAVAILVRDGKLDADAPIATWLRGLPDWSRTITARQLLHHTSGLPAFGVLEHQLPGHWTTEAVLDALRRVPAPTPGPHAYCNVGYVLLAELVAAVSGEPFPAFAERHLGIGCPADPLAMPQLALLGSRLPLSLGDGGLWTSAREFALWLHRCNRDEYGIEALVTASHPDAPDYGWGLGIRSFRGQPMFIHGGSWPGAFSKAARCPTLGIGVVVMTAADSNALVLPLVDAMLDAMASHPNLG